LIALLTAIELRVCFGECLAPTKTGLRMKNRRPRVFVSHSWNDKAQAIDLSAKLESAGAEVWRDDKNIAPGESILQQIAGALGRTDYVLILLSKVALRSNTVRHELFSSLFGMLRRHRPVVIPVLLEPLTLPIFLADINYINFSSPDQRDHEFTRLLQRLGLHVTPKIARRPSVIDVPGQISENDYLLGRFFGADLSVREAEFVSWCLQGVLNDQFLSGYARGGWAKQYREYLKFIFGGSKASAGTSFYDTITFSAWVSEAISSFAPYLNHTKRRPIIVALDRLGDYITSRYDVDGGFGPIGHPRTGEGARVEPNLRHSAWGIRIICNAVELGPVADVMLSKTGQYIRDLLNKIDLANQPSITIAAWQSVIANPEIRSKLGFEDTEAETLTAEAENALVQRFERDKGAWQMDSNANPRGRPDGVLYVLASLRETAITNVRLRDQIVTALEWICTRDTIRVTKDEYGIPFLEGGHPTRGMTLHCLWQLSRFNKIYEPPLGYVEAYKAFCTRKVNTSAKAPYEFSWHRASGLQLISRALSTNH
jgi:TIR domain